MDYFKKVAIIKIMNIAIPKYINLMMVDNEKPKNFFCMGLFRFKTRSVYPNNKMAIEYSMISASFVSME